VVLYSKEAVNVVSLDADGKMETGIEMETVPQENNEEIIAAATCQQQQRHQIHAADGECLLPSYSFTDL